MALLENQRFGGRGLVARFFAWGWLAILGLVAVMSVCVAYLETAPGPVQVRQAEYAGTPTTLYIPPSADRLVVVAHGFGGSRQMMAQIALPLAQQGLLVATIDLPGHGRNRTAMSGDVTQITGTTEQLVQATVVATNDMAAELGLRPHALIGHSMASDVVIRSAGRLPDIEKVVAISMYSEAVTKSEPTEFLILSGAFEGRLREVAERAVHMVDDTVDEGSTAMVGGVARRAVAVDGVGHVGVLYASQSTEEIGAWLGVGSVSAPRVGMVTLVLLGAALALAWPVSRQLPQAEMRPRVAASGAVWPVFVVPAFAALAISLLPVHWATTGMPLIHLGLVMAVWAVAQGYLLYRLGARVAVPDPIATLVFLVLGLGVFALSLDSYGASFAPSGDRWFVLLGLLPASLALMLADSGLRQVLKLWQVYLVRLTFLITLVVAMAVNPTQLGLAFTVLPVTVLFFIVYGTIARCVEGRRGRGSADIGLGVAYAWALACSTPMFAAGVG